MTNRTAPLKELLEAADFSKLYTHWDIPPGSKWGKKFKASCCKKTPHCKHFKAANDAEESIVALGFDRGDGGWPALDVLIACSDALEELMTIVRNSSGVDGWHLNGDIALWSEFEEVDVAEEALAKVESLNA